MLAKLKRLEKILAKMGHAIEASIVRKIAQSYQPQLQEQQEEAVESLPYKEPENQHLLKELKEFELEKEAEEVGLVIDLLLKEAAKKKKKSKKKKDRIPTKPELWSASKAWAKRKYDVWPSAYAVGAALKRYKEKGGGWRGPKPKK